jgi:hypothetical protein
VRKLLVSIAGVVLLMALAAGVTLAAGTKLTGTFDVTATVKANDVGVPPGTKLKDTYTFKCKSKSCSKVTLTRKSGTRNIKSTLHKNKKGVYVGTEGPVAYTCIDPIGTPGKFTSDHTIKVTKSRAGKATKISGTTVTHITGCKETHETVQLSGKLQ